jgi:hypothetical protein
MAFMIGYNSMIGLAEEATYGTEVTPSTHWLPILGETLGESRDIRPIPYLGVANAAAFHNPRDLAELAVDAGGDIRTCLCYDSKPVLLLLKHALGAVATSGAGPYVHTFTPDWDGVIGLSAHVLKGSGLANPAEDFLGLRVNQLELSLNNREWMLMRASCIAQKGEGPSALVGTPSFATAEEVLAHHAAMLSWNGDSIPMRSFRVLLDNNLVRRPRIGSLYTDVPGPGGFASITVEATVPFESNDLYTDFRAGVQADGSFVFTGTGNNAMTITLENLRWTEVSQPVEQAGELVQTVRAVLAANPTTEYGLKVAVTNDNAAAT